MPAPSANFGSFGTFPGIIDDCGLGPIVNEEEHTIAGLSQKRQQLLAAYNAWLSNPTDVPLQLAYQTARKEKEEVYKGLLRSLLSAKDFTTAEQIISQEGDLRSSRWLIGLKLLAEDYNAAQLLNNQYPQTTTDDIIFKDIMDVNINRLQAHGAYTLTTLEENRLYEIAYSESPYRSYARSILSLLKGEIFVDPIDLEVENGEYEFYSNGGHIEEAIFRVFPNPASGRVTVNYPFTEQPLELKLMNLQDAKIINTIKLPVGSSYDINIQHLPAGIYTVTIQDNQDLLYTDKLVIIR